MVMRGSLAATSMLVETHLAQHDSLRSDSRHKEARRFYAQHGTELGSRALQTLYKLKETRQVCTA